MICRCIIWLVLGTLDLVKRYYTYKNVNGKLVFHNWQPIIVNKLEEHVFD